MQCKPKEKRCRDEVVKKLHDKKQHGLTTDERSLLDAPLGWIHLRLGFHADLDQRTVGRDRGISMMNLAGAAHGRHALTALASIDYEGRREGSGVGPVRDSRDSRDLAR